MYQAESISHVPRELQAIEVYTYLAVLRMRTAISPRLATSNVLRESIIYMQTQDASIPDEGAALIVKKRAMRGRLASFPNSR